MKKILPLIFILLTHFLNAQPFRQATSDAFVITRMAEKFHVQPRQLNDSFSNDVFNQFMKAVDQERIFLIREDIDQLQQYRFKLDDLIRQKDPAFLQLASDLLQQRLNRSDTMIDNICKTPFNFNIPETLTAIEDSSYPANVSAMHIKLYKRIKLAVLESLIDVNDDFIDDGKTLGKKQFDSFEIIARKKVAVTFKRSIKAMLQRPGGLQQDIADDYCEAIASCYDPHSDYFPLTEKENFESDLGNGAFNFGFTLDDKEDDDGNSADGNGVKIGSLKPGSPAFKSGLLNKGDKIISLQWEGREAIDVSDADADEIGKILSESNQDKITFTIKKSDGSVRQVILKKEKEDRTADDDENKVKSFLLKGNKTIGYISLPAFYSDWQNERTDVNGCANDVASEILKLEKENISGLILDLRYNGGGSMEEAIALSGIFIDAGPVAQIKDRTPKIMTLKDVDRGSIYSGPLLIMINGYSASASEMVAGTLQDYNRALIAGTPTFGKATAQVILPMDTTIDYEKDDIEKKTTPTYLKLTVNKLYRVTGATAQGKGVQPDILIPDLLELHAEREADEPFTLPLANIDANKYYKPYPPINVQNLKIIAAEEIASNDYFKAIAQYARSYQTLREDKDFPLRWSDAIADNKKFTDAQQIVDKARDSANVVFTVDNNTYQKQRLASDEDLREINDKLREYLLKDHNLSVAYSVICGMPE
jgi:carboxyl-terminal processing protease